MDMKRFIVESVMTATEENKNFSGAVHVYYHGKEDRLLGTEGNEHLKINVSLYELREYGYKRLCDARRCYSYKHPQNDKFWTTEVNIIEVAIA